MEREEMQEVNLLAEFENGLSLDGDGWAQLAPFGDYPGQALVEDPTVGCVRKFQAIQRLDPQAASEMVRNFHSPWSRLRRYFTGCPIYVGHPDAPGSRYATPASPMGMIVDMEVRGDGLYCKPVFTEEGGSLVKKKTYRAFSGHWTAREIGVQKKDGALLKLFRPERLKSAGLTNHPNLPVHYLNEQTKEENMNKEIVIHFLASQGIQLTNQANDQELKAALETLGTRLVRAETTLAASTLQIEAARADLVNERQSHASTLIQSAITAGKLTPAQKADWTERFAADFANTARELEAQPGLFKTKAMSADAAKRKLETGSVSARRQAVESLVRAEMISNGGHYDAAFQAVQQAYPALFESMKQPGKDT